MTALREFRCEVCGLVTTNPIHSFVIRCGDSELTVYRRFEIPATTGPCGASS